MPFTYQVVRRPRRKTACISIAPDCSIRILVPPSYQQQQIEALVQQKSQWIQDKLAHFQALQAQQQTKSYCSGEHFSYLGRKYQLNIIEQTKQSAPEQATKLVQGRFMVPVPAGLAQEEAAALVRERLITWFQEHAAQHLLARTIHYAKQLSLSPALVGIKNYRSCWGTCHSDGRIYYNWRVIAAPQNVVDYLVVHELCHLAHPNHSKRFWKLVATMIPDHKERRVWLKENGRSLGV